MNKILKETADKIRAERLELQAKIKQMKAAEDKIRELLAEDGDEPAKKVSSSRVTVADKIKTVLLSYPNGLDINTLTSAVHVKYQDGTPKSTLQSQLSRMGDDEVENIEGKWRLAGASQHQYGVSRPRGDRSRDAGSQQEQNSIQSQGRYDLDDEIPF